jgi:ferredoxin-thioredoxin reductase catalytic subunit
VRSNEITAAHEPHLPADELDDIREHAERLPDVAGSAKELRSLLLQAIDDLHGAYARIRIAYDRLDQDCTDSRPKAICPCEAFDRDLSTDECHCGHAYEEHEDSESDGLVCVASAPYPSVVDHG